MSTSSTGSPSGDGSPDLILDTLRTRLRKLPVLRQMLEDEKLLTPELQRQIETRQLEIEGKLIQAQHVADPSAPSGEMEVLERIARNTARTARNTDPEHDPVKFRYLQEGGEKQLQEMLDEFNRIATKKDARHETLRGIASELARRIFNRWQSSTLPGKAVSSDQLYQRFYGRHLRGARKR